MITVLIRTKEDDGGRQVHGVVHLDTPEGCVTDPACMDVVARYPRPEKLSQLTHERVPLMACVRNLKKRHGLSAREVLRALRSLEDRILHTDPIHPSGKLPLQRPAAHS